MPPRGHSSSSSHSSSRSSSSRSSSSRSSSSRSSSLRSSRSSRGPSSHSSTSHSSRPIASGGSSRRRQQPERTRSNQPTGYKSQYGGSTRRYYGRRHDYVFFPVAWIDAETGRHYERGYYDENGQHYDSVAFAQNGTYDNVICHCPYCNHESILSISTTEANDKSLACPNCGGTMEIRSALDDYAGSDDDGTYRSTGEPRRKRSGLLGLLIAIIVAVLALAGISVYNRKAMQQQAIEQYYAEQEAAGSNDSEEDLSGHTSFGTTIALTKTGDHSYTVSESGGDKTLVWDSGTDSYYDEETNCWIWYNTDVEPAVWQYWYEGISSDYGDYGWMEHAQDGWFIEESYGSWIQLPGQYDSESLWYID